MNHCFIIFIVLLSGFQKAEFKCLSSEHKCGENNFFNCIPGEWVCDHNVDCHDGSDEANCPKLNCQLDQFKCFNSDQCIKKSQLCDGKIDCIDNSDEFNCTNLSMACNKLTEYDCLNNNKIECIPLKNVCEGNFNCSNGKNLKENCTKDMCQDANIKHHCSHKCINKYSTFVCDCPIGMKLDNDNLNCKKVDDCLDNPNKCSQECSLTHDGYRCSCYEGFGAIGSECIVSDASKTPHLLYLSYGGIYDMELFNNLQRTSANQRKLLNIPDELVTFDAKLVGTNLELYSSYFEKDNVVSLNILNDWNIGSGKGISKADVKIVSKTFSWSSSFYSLAVDPVRDLVFWTNTNTSKISVFNASSTDQYDIIIKDCYRPINLVLNPISAKIFWIDLGNTVVNPRIMMANMDGSEQTVLIKSGLRKPTSLALDIENYHLYWNDLFPGSIQFIDLKSLSEKSSIKVLFENHDYSPISLAVYKNRVYWSDWRQKRIYSVHKISGKGLTTVVEQVQASTIRIISSLSSNKLSREVNDVAVKATSCSGDHNPCHYSCLPTSNTNQAKCFGSAHKMKVSFSPWWFIVIPIALLSIGGFILAGYRHVKSKNCVPSSNNYAKIYVNDTVNFWDDGNGESRNESEEVNVSDSIPIIQTV